MEKLAILVISCDKYSDVWDPFFKLFFKFWSDCPYKIYLGTNSLSYDDPRVNMIHIGEGKAWADDFRNMLEFIEEKYVLTFLDDYLIVKKVNSKIVKYALEVTEKEQIDCCKLWTRPRGSIPFAGYNDLFEIQAKDKYCVNAAAAIWTKELLKILLKPGFSAWDFELGNSRHINEIGKLPGRFVTTQKTEFIVLNGVTKGKWLPTTVRKCERLGVSIDTKQRGVLSGKVLFIELLRTFIADHVPLRIRNVVKPFLIKLGFGRMFVSDY